MTTGVYSLSGCHTSVAEYWMHKPVVLGLTPGDCWAFHSPLFHLETFLMLE